MKLQFLATGNAPDSYEINGETVTAHNNEQSEIIDLSPIEEGGKFKGIELEVLDLPASQVIRDAYRENGELHVTLCQQTPYTRAVIRFQGIPGFVEMPYQEFNNLEFSKGDIVPDAVKEQSSLKTQLTALFKRQASVQELSDEHKKEINEKYEEADLIVSEILLKRGGHWRKSDWINAGDYDPEQTYIKNISEDTDGEA
jgi:hypothetical protein